MTYSLFDRCGWNPTEVHARLYGRKPAGIVVVTAEERAKAEREAKGRETQPPPPPVDVKEEGDPPQPVPTKATGEVADAPRADGEGSPPGTTTDGSFEDADPRHHPAATGTAARPAPADDLPPASHSSRLHPGAGEDRDELDVPARLSASPGLKDWLVRNWETIAALEAAGDLADFAAPTPGEPAEAAPPPPPPPLPPVHVRKGDRWNRPKMADFLRQLAATHSVSAAARSVGMSRESAYRLRNRLKGQPFDIAWEAAFRQGYDNLAHAALDRAVNGVEVPHYCNGELVGTSRKYDERLTVALLAMRNRYGAPQMGRYGAAAEWWSERWDAMLQRVESGSLDWQDEQRALGQPLDGEAHVQALINKHAPDEGPVTPRRR